MNKNFFLIDSKVDIDKIDKSGKSKIITFDYVSHVKLVEQDISHDTSDDFVSDSELDQILDLSMNCSYWFKHPQFKEILEFNNFNLGELFYIEIKENLISFLKEFVTIQKIFSSNKEKNFFISPNFEYFFKAEKIPYILITKNINDSINDSINDYVEIPITIIRKQFSIKLQKNKIIKIKNFLNFILKYSMKKKFYTKAPTFLLVDFSTLRNSPILLESKFFKFNLIKYDSILPAVWNFNTFKIIKKSNCIIENSSTLNNLSSTKKINNIFKILLKKISELEDSDIALNRIFSYNQKSFWPHFKNKFFLICHLKFQEFSQEYVYLENLIQKYPFKAILMYGEISLSQQILINLLKQHNVRILILEHGLNYDSAELEINNSFYKFPPKNFDFLLVWGEIYRNYLIKYGVDAKKIHISGSVFFENIFNNKISNFSQKNFILLATDPFALMQPHELTNDFAEKYANVIKTVYQIAKKNKKSLIIKTHPQKNSIETFVAKKIDPSITVITSGDILPLIKSSDLVIVTDMSTVILESQALKKPVVSIKLRNNYGEPEPFKSKFCKQLELNQLEKWVDRLFESEDFMNNIILRGNEFVKLYTNNIPNASKKILDFLVNMT